MSKRDLSLNKYDIDKYEYRELKYFCLRYDKLTEKNKALIEQAAREAACSSWRDIFKSVTEDIPYEHMQAMDGRRQFYEKRRKFFYVLSQKKRD